jgi:hypothetical protein
MRYAASVTQFLQVSCVPVGAWMILFGINFIYSFQAGKLSGHQNKSGSSSWMLNYCCINNAYKSGLTESPLFSKVSAVPTLLKY